MAPRKRPSKGPSKAECMSYKQPKPFGVDPTTWNDAFNKVDSRIYKKNGSNKYMNAYARQQRITYTLAIKELNKIDYEVPFIILPLLPPPGAVGHTRSPPLAPGTHRPRPLCSSGTLTRNLLTPNAIEADQQAYTMASASESAGDSGDDDQEFCFCRKPADGAMVMCDGCEEWYHLSCINEPPQMMEMWFKYFCKQCVVGGKEVEYHPYCRLRTFKRCDKPARYQLVHTHPGMWKYCCDDHAKKFFEAVAALIPDLSLRSRPGEPLTLDEVIRMFTNTDDLETFKALGNKPELEKLVEGLNQSLALEPAKIRKTRRIRKVGGSSKNRPTQGDHAAKSAAQSPHFNHQSPQIGPLHDPALFVGSYQPVSANNTTVVNFTMTGDSESATADVNMEEFHSNYFSVDSVATNNGNLDDANDSLRLRGGGLSENFTKEEATHMAEIETAKSRVDGTLNLYKHRETLTSMIKARNVLLLSKIKEHEPSHRTVCGYDSRLSLNDAELEEFVETWDKKLEAPELSKSSLSGTDKLVDGNFTICAKKKCARHGDWAKMVKEENRYQVFLATKEQIRLEMEEDELRETAAVRFLEADDAEDEDEDEDEDFSDGDIEMETEAEAKVKINGDK